MNRTPCVARPIGRASRATIRRTLPCCVINRTSSSASTQATPATLPFLSLAWMLIIPSPPRDCTRYSPSSVRLPYPFSVTVRSVAPGRTTVIATTSSPARSAMPRTPRAVRPMERTSDCGKRMAIPARVPMKISPCPSVSSAPTTASSGSTPMAMMPPDRTCRKALRSTRLTTPRRVPMATKCRPGSVGNSLRVSSAAIFSSGSSATRLAMALPRPAGPTSGIRWTLRG